MEKDLPQERRRGDSPKKLREALHPINGGARAAASQEEIMEVRGKWPNELVYEMEAFDSTL
jgi:hypothetical protein